MINKKCATNIRCLKEITDELLPLYPGLSFTAEEKMYIDILITSLHNINIKDIPEYVGIKMKEKAKDIIGEATTQDVDGHVPFFVDALKKYLQTQSNLEERIHLFLPLDDIIKAINILNFYKILIHQNHIIKETYDKYYPEVTTRLLKCPWLTMGAIQMLVIIAPLIPDSITNKLINNTITDGEINDLYLYSQIGFSKETLENLANELTDTSMEERNTILEQFYKDKIKNLPSEGKARILQNIDERSLVNESLDSMKLMERVWSTNNKIR